MTAGSETWASIPRVYIVLRLIGALHLLDSFLALGMNDLWLPFSQSTLPAMITTPYHERFLEPQSLVLTKALTLENSSLARHAHLGKDDVFPFEEGEKLGEGGYGPVHRVVSKLSGREFARKRFRRGRGQQYKGAWPLSRTSWIC